MQRFLFETAKVVGTATENSWSQVHLFSPEDPGQRKLRGELLAVLSLNGLSQGVEAVATGREVISRLHEEYYGNLSGGALERLEKAVNKVCQEAASSDPESEVGIKVEIGAAVVLDNVLYLAILGSGAAILQRNGQMGRVLSGSQTIEVASGFLQESDIFLLGTAGFFARVADGVLKAALASRVPDEAAETLAPVIHGHEESGLAAAVICQFRQESEVDISTVGAKAVKVNDNRESDRLVTKVRDQTQSGSGDKKFKIGFSGKELLARTVGKWFYQFQKRLEKKAIYLKQERQGLSASGQGALGIKPERSKKTIFSVVFVLLLILAVSVYFGGQQRKKINIEQKTDIWFEEAQQKLAEGEALLDLNPALARQYFLEVQELNQRIETEGLGSEEFLKFKTLLNQRLSQVIKERSVEVSEFFDLELIKPKARGDDWAFSGKKMIILDKQNNSVYELDTQEKKSAIIAGGENLKGALQVAAYLPKVFVLSENGILSINRLSKKEQWVVSSKEVRARSIDFLSFASNLYLLEEGVGLWQYPVAETGFGNERFWLKEEGLDFTGAVSMAIDGSIWVLKEGGIIWKFSRGLKDAFGIAGLEEAFNRPVAIYTNDEAENLYLLDQGNSQVVVLAKSGEYQASYRNEKLAQAERIVCSEEVGKIWFLSGSKIFEIDIRN
ncbi:hypothetical protein ACFL0Y_01105 [Patescibacteria group bacterium]